MIESKTFNTTLHQRNTTRTLFLRLYHNNVSAKMPDKDSICKQCVNVHIINTCMISPPVTVYNTHRTGKHSIMICLHKPNGHAFAFAGVVVVVVVYASHTCGRTSFQIEAQAFLQRSDTIVQLQHTHRRAHDSLCDRSERRNQRFPVLCNSHLVACGRMCCGYRVCVCECICIGSIYEFIDHKVTHAHTYTHIHSKTPNHTMRTNTQPRPRKVYSSEMAEPVEKQRQPNHSPLADIVSATMFHDGCVACVARTDISGLMHKLNMHKKVSNNTGCHAGSLHARIASVYYM